MPRKRRVKSGSPRLTQLERRMLLYPPTEGTWICKNKKDDGTICNTPLSGTTMNCLFCGSAQGENPARLWPTYVKACNKVGVEPGRILWKEENGVALMRIKGETGWIPWSPDNSSEFITRSLNGETKTRKIRRKKINT